jgi:hypothetical protein
LVISHREAAIGICRRIAASPRNHILTISIFDRLSLTCLVVYASYCGPCRDPRSRPPQSVSASQNQQ